MLDEIINYVQSLQQQVEVIYHLIYWSTLIPFHYFIITFFKQLDDFDFFLFCLLILISIVWCSSCR